MEKLIEILKKISGDINFKEETSLIDDGLLDSIEVISIVTELEDAFGIEINPGDIDPDNFQSVETMWEMIQRLLESRQ